MTKRRAVKLLGLGLAAALIGAGAGAVVSRLGDAAPELQRPDLLIALGVCVVVWLGASSEDGETLRAAPAEEALPEA